jgi:hypothetical protein
MKDQDQIPNEPILDDNYPIYADYWYVLDGTPVRSDYHDITAREFKLRMKAKEIRRCNIIYRSQNTVPTN